MPSDKISTPISFIITLLGFWLFASTVTFGFHSPWIITTNCLSSLLLILIGWRSRGGPARSQIWMVAAIGIWLQFAPLIFWAKNPASYVNDTFIGVVLIALSITLHPIPGQSFQEKPTIPPGWSYNPSSWSQRLPIAFLAFCCWMISRYMAAYQLGYIDTVWEPFFDPGTKAVLESKISKAFPVSDAGLGAFAYTLEFFSACQGSATRWRTAPWLVLVFGFLVIPVSLVSTLLIILQPLAVGTWCTLCLATAFCMLIGIPFAIAEVGASIQFLRTSKEKPFWQLLFQGGRCPHEKPDHLSPSMDRPLSLLLKSALTGVSFPPTLICSALLGITLMTLSSPIDPIIGALTTAFSIISFAEYARPARFLNLLFAFLLFLITFPSPLHIALSLAIALCALPQGRIKERFHLQLDHE